jgi:hypothetical protein
VYHSQPGGEHVAQYEHYMAWKPLLCNQGIKNCEQIVSMADDSNMTSSMMCRNVEDMTQN